MGPSLFFVYYFNCFFLRLIIICRLWVIYVRENNDSNVQVMITRLMWTIWTPMSSVLKKADKLNLSLSLSTILVDFKAPQAIELTYFSLEDIVVILPVILRINIYKFWQNCASVRQVSDLILKTGSNSIISDSSISPDLNH